MKILGVDPGWENTGWGVIENHKLHTRLPDGQVTNYKLVECGVIKLKAKSLKLKEGDRLREIYEGVGEIIRKYKPEVLAIESLFFFKNAKSVIKVAKAIGVIEVCAANNGVRVVEVTPLQVKMSLTGYGRADKDQVERMVGNMLGLEKTIEPSHAADAVAVAMAVMGYNQL